MEEHQVISALGVWRLEKKPLIFGTNARRSLRMSLLE
jgi:hypothetical protein